MNNLEKILDKIKQDAASEASKITEEKKKLREKIIEEKTKQAQDEALKIIDDAKKVAAQRLSNAETKANREKRDIKLRAKNDVVEKVLDLALEKLKRISKEDYLRFIKSHIKNLDVKDAAITLSEQYKDMDVSFLPYKKSDETVEDGFLITKGNIVYDNSFKSLIEYNRNEYEQIITEKLFK